MSIGNVNNSSNLAAVSTVSGVDQAQPAADTAKAKQPLHISMLASEMQPVLLKLERFAGEVTYMWTAFFHHTGTRYAANRSGFSKAWW